MIHNAQEAFQELMETPDHAIPRELLESAKCMKVGFIVDAEVGKVWPCVARNTAGAARVPDACRRRLWSPDRASTDLLMVFRNREGFQTLLSDKFKIGADATAAAGPVGPDTCAATEMHAEILTYSRRRGVFAGVSLDGTVVAPDHEADEALYGAGVDRETTEWEGSGSRTSAGLASRNPSLYRITKVRSQCWKPRNTFNPSPS